MSQDVCLGLCLGDCGLWVGTQHVQESLKSGMSTEAQVWGLGTEHLPLGCPAKQGQSGFCPVQSLA